jgi:hypothetical protein
LQSKGLRFGAVAVLLVAGWLLIRWYGSEERLINRNLKQIQKAVAKVPGESNLKGLAKARSVSEMFADNFEFEAGQFNFYTRDRQQLVSGILQYRSSAQAILMQIRDKELNVDARHGRATSDLTADFITKASDITGREAYRFQINWVERDGEWRIDYVRLLEVIQEPARTVF